MAYFWNFIYLFFYFLFFLEFYGTCHEWPIKQAIVDLPIRLEGNAQRKVTFKPRIKLNHDIFITISDFRSVIDDAKVISCLVGCI